MAATQLRAQKSADTLFNHYKKLNAEEQRLQEFADPDDALKNKLKQLEVINANRKRYKAKPLQLDILACRVANKMCKEAALNGYMGHWNLAGEKPYQRYAFAGGKDHVSENASSRSVNGASLDVSDEGIQSNMEYLHGLFMSERAPNDGHKDNCIDKSHTHVGIGYYTTKNEFRYYEEYVDRYLEFENVPETLRPGEKVMIRVKAPKGQYLYFLSAYYEDFPKAMKKKQIENKDSYTDFTDHEVTFYSPLELNAMKKGSEYVIPLSFKKPGLYYIQIGIDSKLPSGDDYNTKDKTIASGIVIKVQNVK